MAKTKMRQINLKLTEEQHQALEEIGEMMGGISKSNLIRFAISDLIKRYKE